MDGLTTDLTSFRYESPYKKLKIKRLRYKSQIGDLFGSDFEISGTLRSDTAKDI